MNLLDFFLIIFVMFGLWLITNQHIEMTETRIITAITDNGCSKPSKQELSQTKTNADVYNYAALSTSYKR